MKERPIIDLEKCQKCGLCISVCACGALQLLDNTVKTVEVEDCQWCAMCELVCPAEAITCPYEIIVEDKNG